MARILFFLFLAFLVWLAVRVIGSKRRSGDAGPPAAPTREAIESISQCAWCGVHVPAGSAVSLPDGRVYCGVPHRDAARVAAEAGAR